MADKTRILSLYRSMLRESQKISTYNFREFFIRRIRDNFKDNMALKDTAEIQKQIVIANENLNMIRRQAVIGNMYQTEKLVIEK